MSDVTKKLKKFARSTQTAIAVEASDDMLIPLSAAFGTVFAFSVTVPLVKKKNIVYREQISDIGLMPESGLIYVEPAGLRHLPEFRSIFQHHKPTLMIWSGEHLDKKITRWIVDQAHYELVDLAKRHQLWKFKQ
jgi:hypothetical protein